MQKTYKGLTAKQIIKAARPDSTNRLFTTIDGVEYTVVSHDRVELNNGDWTGTVVLESPNQRIVLESN